MRTTFKLPKALKEEYSVFVLKKYGGRKKSIWINRAIKELWNQDKKLQSIGLGDERYENDANESILLDNESIDIVDEISRILRRQKPDLERVQGIILRSSIRWLLKQENAA